jgi:hypothetical protein
LIVCQIGFVLTNIDDKTASNVAKYCGKKKVTYALKRMPIIAQILENQLWVLFLKSKW